MAQRSDCHAENRRPAGHPGDQGPEGPADGPGEERDEERLDAGGSSDGGLSGIGRKRKKGVKASARRRFSGVGLLNRAQAHRCGPPGNPGSPGKNLQF